MSIFKKIHKFMKRGRVHRVVKMVTKENENVRKTKKHRRKSAQGNA